MNKTNEGERCHRVYSNLLSPLYIIGKDCDHGNVESKNTSKGHPHGNHLFVGLGSQVYCKVKTDFIEVQTYYNRAKIIYIYIYIYI